MTEQEQADVDKLNADNQRRRNGFFEMVRTISRADDRVMEQMGFKGKSKGDAILFYFESTNGEILKAIKAHVRKYPD